MAGIGTGGRRARYHQEDGVGDGDGHHGGEATDHQQHPRVVRGEGGGAALRDAAQAVRRAAVVVVLHVQHVPPHDSVHQGPGVRGCWEQVAAPARAQKRLQRLIWNPNEEQGKGWAQGAEIARCGRAQIGLIG